jgi:DNA polymerase (family X)
VRTVLRQTLTVETSSNRPIADRLREAADLLQQQGANPFRVAAYRRAADSIAGLDTDLNDLVVESGSDGLLDIPHVGPGIAAAVQELLRTGRWSQLERIRGTLDPVKLFQTVPGVGPELARRLHETLHVDTLEALEVAVHDGRVRGVPGFGRRRAAALRATLGTLLGRLRLYPQEPQPPPSVELVLDVDREYREKAATCALPRIAPRRFNPEGKAWLAVLHTLRKHWHFTAMYSNTARAHELERTHDWVVVYFYDDRHVEGQHTVVTETRGPLAGRRVIRGREAECRTCYADPPHR